MVWTQLSASRAHLGDIKETPIAAAVAGRLEIEEVDQEDRRKDDRTLHRQPIAFSAGMPSIKYVRTSTPPRVRLGALGAATAGQRKGDASESTCSEFAVGGN